MANETQVQFTGFVATEPAVKPLDDGKSMTTLRVASTPRRFNRRTGEWCDGPTSFMSVACWRKLAENVALCLRKGDPVVVVGTMRVRRYDAKDGSPRTDVEVDATSIGHDLSRGVARFQRIRGQSGGASGAPDPDGGAPDPDGGAVAGPAETGAVAEADPAAQDAPPKDAAGTGAGGEDDDVLDDRMVAALLDKGAAPGMRAPAPL